MIKGFYACAVILGAGFAATIVTCLLGWLAKSEIEEPTSDWHLTFAVLGFVAVCAVNGYAMLAAVAYK